jgi:hypothetical protein
LSEKNKLGRMRLIWAFLLCISFPIAISLPFMDAYIFRHVPLEIVVPFEFGNALLSVSSILFGFTLLIIISKEWVDKRIWAVLVPPLILIVLSGVSIGNWLLAPQTK